MTISINNDKLKNELNQFACSNKHPIEEEKLFSLFQENKMIAHSVNPYPLENIAELDVPAVKYRFLDGFFDKLYQGGGLQDLSTTLLVCGKRVATYRSDGVLFNADFVTPHAITKGDGNTCVDKDGKVVVTDQLKDLEELREYVLKDEPNRPLMNEVKGNFPVEALVGLYIRKNKDKNEEAKTYLKTLLVQNKIKTDHGRELPIFKYDQDLGSLESVDCSFKSRAEAYMKVKSSLTGNLGKVIANTVAQTLGDQKPF